MKKFIVIAALGVAALTAAEHVSVGVWKLNLSKSKGLNPAPRSSVITASMEGNTRTVETHTVFAGVPMIYDTYARAQPAASPIPLSQ